MVNGYHWIFIAGPSYAVDTACSSSLLALDHALRAIRTGQCDAAIVGGTSLCMHPSTTAQFAKLGMLSPDGACKSFDTSGRLNSIMHFWGLYKFKRFNFELRITFKPELQSEIHISFCYMNADFLSVQAMAIVAVKPSLPSIYKRRNRQGVSMPPWFIRKPMQMVSKTKVFLFYFLLFKMPQENSLVSTTIINPSG